MSRQQSVPITTNHSPTPVTTSKELGGRALAPWENLKPEPLDQESVLETEVETQGRRVPEGGRRREAPHPLPLSPGKPGGPARHPRSQVEGRREKVKGPRGTYRRNEESQILREKSQGDGRAPSLLLWKDEEGSRAGGEEPTKDCVAPVEEGGAGVGGVGVPSCENPTPLICWLTCQLGD